MFLARRPSAGEIDRFLEASQDLPLSYAPTGIVRDAHTRHACHAALAAIGRGRADFERAKTALIAWKHFDIGWIEVLPRDAPIATGTVVAVLIRHLGFWSLNGCRILYRLGSPDDTARFGFGYGALTNHAEAGEELFEVSIDSRTNTVFYRIRAASWPQSTLARVGRPIVRTLQARFRSHSAAAMARAVRSAGADHPAGRSLT